MDDGTCRECGGEMQPATGSRKRIYCSEPCRNRAKWARRKAVYHAELAAGLVPRIRQTQTKRDRSRGVRPRQTGEQKICPVCTTSFGALLGQVYCSATCRRRADNQRNRGACPTMVLMSLASRFGAYAPKLKPVACRVSVGVIVDCPNCSTVMGATDPINRACHACGTTLVLNEEEVSWVISERRSSEASRRTARSLAA